MTVQFFIRKKSKIIPTMRSLQRRNLILLSKLLLTISCLCITVYLFLGFEVLRDKLGVEIAYSRRNDRSPSPLVVEELEGYFVYPRIFSPSHIGANETLVLVSHTSSNHLHQIPVLAKRWKASISLVVFAPTSQIFLEILSTISDLRACDDVVRRFVTFHVATLSKFEVDELIHQKSDRRTEECQQFLNRYSNI